MRLWLIPTTYLAVSAVCGLTLPRLEQIYLTSYTFDISVASAQAYLSAVASGMMALTGIVFAMAFVMVQFSAIAYSPRLVLWLARDPDSLPLARDVRSDVHLRTLHAWLGRSRRVRHGAALLHSGGWRDGPRQHAPVRAPRAEPGKSPDHKRAPGDRRREDARPSPKCLRLSMGRQITSGQAKEMRTRQPSWAPPPRR